MNYPVILAWRYTHRDILPVVDPEAVHATAHEELWIEFVEEAVERTDNPELIEIRAHTPAFP